MLVNRERRKRKVKHPLQNESKQERVNHAEFKLNQFNFPPLPPPIAMQQPLENRPQSVQDNENKGGFEMEGRTDWWEESQPREQYHSQGKNPSEVQSGGQLLQFIREREERQSRFMPDGQEHYLEAEISDELKSLNEAFLKERQVVLDQEDENLYWTLYNRQGQSQQDSIGNVQPQPILTNFTGSTPSSTITTNSAPSTVPGSDWQSSIESNNDGNGIMGQNPEELLAAFQMRREYQLQQANSFVSEVFWASGRKVVSVGTQTESILLCKLNSNDLGLGTVGGWSVWFDPDYTKYMDHYWGNNHLGSTRQSQSGPSSAALSMPMNSSATAFQQAHSSSIFLPEGEDPGRHSLDMNMIGQQQEQQQQQRYHENRARAASFPPGFQMIPQPQSYSQNDLEMSTALSDNGLSLMPEKYFLEKTEEVARSLLALQLEQNDPETQVKQVLTPRSGFSGYPEPTNDNKNEPQGGPSYDSHEHHQLQYDTQQNDPDFITDCESNANGNNIASNQWTNLPASGYQTPRQRLMNRASLANGNRRGKTKAQTRNSGQAMLFPLTPSPSSGQELVWTGTLGPKDSSRPCYSEKVFIGGLGPRITKNDLAVGFHRFGVTDVSWCARDGAEKIAGCAFVTLKNREMVGQLIRCCKPWVSQGNFWKDQPTLHYEMKYRQFKTEVEIILWDIYQSRYFDGVLEKQNSRAAIMNLTNSYAIFVGNLHARFSATDLANFFIDLGLPDVLRVQIVLDKANYPVGWAKVTFASYDTFVKAIRARKLIVDTTTFSRILDIRPFVEDSNPCTRCRGTSSIFCKNELCCSYYCTDCFKTFHSLDGGIVLHSGDDIVRRTKGRDKPSSHRGHYD